MKTVIWIFITSVMLYATNLPYNNNLGKYNNIPQKSIVTKKDFIELETTLKEAVGLGDYSKAMILGILYLQPFPFQKPQPKKAIYYLKLALKHNIALAAIPLSYIVEPIKAIDILDKGIQKAIKPEIKLILAIREVELVLNKLYFNKDVVIHTIKIVNPILKSSDNPVLEFGVAHLFFILKDINTANYYINKACNSKMASKDLLNLCINDPFLQKEEK